MPLMPSPSPQVLANTVDIYPATRTQDADGAPQFPSGGASKTSVPCSVQQRSIEEVVDEQGRITREAHYHVFFAVDPGLKPRDRMRWIDALGVVRTLIHQATRDEAGRNAIFVSRAIEKL